MDWKKLNFDEIGYFCKSTRAESDFACFPLRYQIEMLLGVLLFYKIAFVQIRDLQIIYSILQIRKMKSEGIIVPSFKKLHAILEKLTLDHKVSEDLDGYKINNNNLEDQNYFKEKIEEGYQKDFIKDWIVYNQKMSLVKLENIPGIESKNLEIKSDKI